MSYRDWGTSQADMSRSWLRAYRSICWRDPWFHPKLWIKWVFRSVWPGMKDKWHLGIPLRSELAGCHRQKGAAWGGNQPDPSNRLHQPFLPVGMVEVKIKKPLWIVQYDTCGKRAQNIGVAFLLISASAIAILSFATIVRNNALKVRLLPEYVLKMLSDRFKLICVNSYNFIGVNEHGMFDVILEREFTPWFETEKFNS